MSASHIALGKGDASSTLSQSFNNSRTGDGYREDWALELGDWRSSTYLILTGGTTPIAEISSSQARVRWAASDSAAICASIRIDGSAQEGHSEYQLILVLIQGGTTDAITVVVTAT